MIAPSFILSNYVNSSFIRTKAQTCNASYIMCNNHKYIIARETNYTFFNPIYKPLPDGRKNIDRDKFIWSDNNVYDADTLELVKKLTVRPKTPKTWACGLEDLRLINWNNTWYAFGTELSPHKDGRQGIMYISEIDESLSLVNRRELKTDQLCEKNWQPIEDRPFKAIYSYKPFTIVDVSDANVKFERFSGNNCDFMYRGSTPIIRWHEFYIGLVHIRNEENKQYVHFLVVYDQNLNIVTISDPFSFFGINIEFCTGMTYDAINDTLNIIVSVNDSLLFNFSMSSGIITDIIHNRYKNAIPNILRYDQMYQYAIQNEDILTATCLATWSDNVKIISHAIYINHFEDNVASTDHDFIVSRKCLLQKMLIKRYKTITSK